MIFLNFGGLLRIELPVKEITNNTTKIKNIIFAIPANAPAIPLKPNVAEIIVTTIKVRAKLKCSISQFTKLQTTHYLYCISLTQS